MLTKFRQDQTVSDMLQRIKGKSSKWINERNELKRKIHWQIGYAAFTVSESQAVIIYIRNQEEHHRHKTFEEEYEEFLQKIGIDYDVRYL